jgi:hypothetical protein
VQDGGVCRLQRHVRATADGDADIRSGKARGIVNAVADVGDDLSRPPKLAYDTLLVLRQQVGARFDPQGASNGRGVRRL